MTPSDTLVLPTPSPEAGPWEAQASVTQASVVQALVPPPSVTASGVPVAARSRRHRRLDPLAATSSALMADTVVTSALGVVFWVVASRTYSPRQLGESAALISAMMLLSVVSQMNLAMGIARFLPQVRYHRGRGVVTAYAATAGVGLVVAACFTGVAPRLSHGFAFLGRDQMLATALVVAVVLWNVFALQDAVLTATRWAVALPVENGLFGALKIGLMIWLARGYADHGVFVAWLLAMAVMLVPVNGLIFWKVLPSRGPGDGSRKATRSSPQAHAPAHAQATVLPLADRARVARYLAVDYVAAILNQGYLSMLPLLVVAVLGRDANAYFYIAFVIAGAVRAVAQSMGTSLVVEGAHDESELVRLTRLSVARYAKYAVPGIAVLVVGANLLLLPFGASYVENGVTLLRLLLVATLPQALVSLYVSVERVRANVGRVLAVEGAVVVLVTAGAIVGMDRIGLAGVGWAWLVAQSIVAGFVVPALWRACREPARAEGP
ncbi:MAG: hypothetical protein QOD63_2982, partial [Actinomycetota bacterium]|nr:hypothetical protein [Actinomycetota bacterium]